jgi:tripeptidyl-peptidase I
VLVGIIDFSFPLLSQTLPAANTLNMAILLALAIAVASLLLGTDAALLKESHVVPPGWTNIGFPHPLLPLTLNIGLEPGDFASLEQHLHQVSDPSHPRYGQHLSQQDVHDLLRPTHNTTDLVTDWLAANNVEYQVNAAQDWITLSLPVSEIEHLLETKYSVFQHDDGTRLVRTTSWSLPRHLHDHITTIQPTTAFLRATPRGSMLMDVPFEADILQAIDAADAANLTTIRGACNFAGMTPKCLRTLYNTISYTPQATKNNSIAFNNFLGQVSNRSDARIFLQNFRPEAVNSAFGITEVSVNGGLVDNTDNFTTGNEGNLDLQTILGLVYPTPVSLYSTAGQPPFQPDLFTPNNTNEPYLTWLLFLRDQDQDTIPKVISTSYGDNEQTVPASYAKVVCNQFAALGAQGISLFFSSGDFGVGSNDTCVSNDGKNTPAFMPAFPASCPYVTTVGGTMGYPEVVAVDATIGFSAGAGFSNYFPRPDWQSVAVDRYLDRIGDQFKGLYNASGRAYPDLSAQAYRYIIWIDGIPHTLDGTSCSAPTVASVFTLVNDALIAKGKPPMGWLNPWLYQKGFEAFTDVVNGSALGCNGPGFSASAGWDAASGFGTPDFEKILDVLAVGP